MKQYKSLSGKIVAITGATGGLGKEICLKSASLGADIIMLNRDYAKTKALINEIKLNYGNVNIKYVPTELEDINSVKAVTEELISVKPDIFIANAGAYSIPRHICDSGYENIFQINFVSPYYMACKLREELPQIKIVAVGSIAHTYSVIDENDIDFRTRKGSALPYGNSKRFLMLALGEKFESGLAVVHPGITFTNITAHYPKFIFAVIKQPMKVIFMKPKKAALCVINGIYEDTQKGSWIGPCFFDVWGRPVKKKLKAAFTSDSQKAIEIAEKIYNSMK